MQASVEPESNRVVEQQSDKLRDRQTETETETETETKTDRQAVRDTERDSQRIVFQKVEQCGRTEEVSTRVNSVSTL
jgi:hypothetical protein